MTGYFVDVNNVRNIIAVATTREDINRSLEELKEIDKRTVEFQKRLDNLVVRMRMTAYGQMG